jgi:hypothetical protein
MMLPSSSLSALKIEAASFGYLLFVDVGSDADVLEAACTSSPQGANSHKKNQH